jgi:hypothetical protein
MVKLSSGDVDVTAGTGFRHDEDGAIEPLVRLTVTTDDGHSAHVWMRPYEARAIGLDLIGGAHAAISDAAVRFMAKEHGLDGDSLIGLQRKVTEAALGPG